MAVYNLVNQFDTSKNIVPDQVIVGGKSHEKKPLR